MSRLLIRNFRGVIERGLLPPLTTLEAPIEKQAVALLNESFQLLDRERDQSFPMGAVEVERVSLLVVRERQSVSVGHLSSSLKELRLCRQYMEKRYPSTTSTLQSPVTFLAPRNPTSLLRL